MQSSVELLHCQSLYIPRSQRDIKKKASRRHTVHLSFHLKKEDIKIPVEKKRQSLVVYSISPEGSRERLQRKIKESQTHKSFIINWDALNQAM